MDELVADGLRARGWTIADGGVVHGRAARRAADRAGGLVGLRPRRAGRLRDEAKVALAGVDPALIGAPGAVSTEVAEALADGARSRLGADVGVGITGMPGPGGGTEEKPVGLVCFSVAGPTARRLTRSRALPGGRFDVRDRSTTVALHLVRRLLAGERDRPRVSAAVRRGRPAGARREALAELGRSAAAGATPRCGRSGRRRFRDGSRSSATGRSTRSSRWRTSSATRPRGGAPPLALEEALWPRRGARACWPSGSRTRRAAWRRSRRAVAEARPRPSASSPSAAPSCRTSRSRACAAAIRRAAAGCRSGAGVDGLVAEAVTLYRSHLGGRGPARYEAVERVAL